MGIIKFPSIFRRKVYAPIHSGEMVMTSQQMVAYKVREAINEILEDIETQGIEIDADELEQRIDEVCKAFGISSPKRRVNADKPEEEVSEAVAKAISYKFKKLEEISRKEKRHTCSQCGAPLNDGKCEYCGTNYN